jgi:GNAT superfamily N-acetyltransferase
LQGVWAGFDDPEARRGLGDRRWPEMILRLAADPPAEHRGHGVVDRRAWIIEDDDICVGMIDVEIYADRTAGLAFVVAPGHRGRGVARRGLGATERTLLQKECRKYLAGSR